MALDFARRRFAVGSSGGGLLSRLGGGPGAPLLGALGCAAANLAAARSLPSSGAGAAAGGGGGGGASGEAREAGKAHRGGRRSQSPAQSPPEVGGWRLAWAEVAAGGTELLGLLAAKFLLGMAFFIMTGTA